MSENSRPIPEGLDVVQESMDAVIRWRWFSHIVWFLLPFCVIWNTFLVFWYVGVLAGGKSVMGGGPILLALAFPLLHVGVGIGLVYYVLCLFFNRTDVTLSPSALIVRSYPLPSPGNKEVSAADLRSFSVRLRRGSRNGVPTYDVMYVTAANREKTLIRSLRREEQAEYIAGALNRFYCPGGNA